MPVTAQPPGTAATAGHAAPEHAARTRRLNILMVNTVHGGGGAGQGSARLAAALQAAGHSVRAFVGDGSPLDHGSRRPQHWRTRRLQDWLARRGFRDCGELSSLLWRLVPEYAQADVVHLHNLHGEFTSVLALPLWGYDKPIVWTLHDQWPLTGGCVYSYDCTAYRDHCGNCPHTKDYPLKGHDRTRLFRWLKPRLVRAARPRFVSPSRWLANLVGEVAELANVPVRVIPNAVPSAVFAPPKQRAACRRRWGLSERSPVAVFACHAFGDRRKGAADAVRALRYAAQRVPHVRVLALGRDSEQFLAKCGIPGHAEPFLQDQSAVAAALGAADVALVPSHADNYPFVVLEALACGTPVVAYRVGGIPEQVAHGQSGLLVRPGDSAGLGVALVEMLSAPQRRRAYGEAGRRFVETNCDPARVAAAYVQEYLRAAAKWRHRRRHDARLSAGACGQWLARRLGWPTGEVAQSRRTP